MVTTMMSLQEDYWESFALREDDIEFLYNYLLEIETPLESRELMGQLVADRIQREKKAIEERRSAGGEVYFPKDDFAMGQALVFPAINWRQGKVSAIREGKNPDMPPFTVIEVEFEDGETREFASDVEEHVLNAPPDVSGDDNMLNPQIVLANYGDTLCEALKKGLENSAEFVRIAGRWFPRALLVDVNVGYLNLAEAILDMEGGGPLNTAKLLETVEMPAEINPKLAEFSLDYALWQDERFDEVGPAGEILWYLHRLEPEMVRILPQFLEYRVQDYDRSMLTGEMLALEQELSDELSPLVAAESVFDEVEIRLLYPHWRVGSLPLSAQLSSLFPTSYQAPRIRFTLVDGDTSEKFPGWVVHDSKYIYGLKEFFEKNGLIPGSRLRVQRGKKIGEVIIHSKSRRPTREWIRTVLVGADSGIVLAMLKQMVSATLDDRTAIAVPDADALDAVWTKMQQEHTPFEQIVVNTLRELTKLNPQSHVHASELYAAVNLVIRCPPGPILALLSSRPWFEHVGDLHFRFTDSE